MIEVTVDRDTITKWDHSLHVGNRVMTELRDQGAPVDGALFPTGVPRGRIVIEEDAFGSLVVRWEE